MADEQTVVKALEQIDEVQDESTAAAARGCKRIVSKCVKVPLGIITPRVCVEVKVCW